MYHRVSFEMLDLDDETIQAAIEKLMSEEEAIIDKLIKEEEEKEAKAKEAEEKAKTEASDPSKQDATKTEGGTSTKPDDPKPEAKPDDKSETKTEATEDKTAGSPSPQSKDDRKIRSIEADRKEFEESLAKMEKVEESVGSEVREIVRVEMRRQNHILRHREASITDLEKSYNPENVEFLEDRQIDEYNELFPYDKHLDDVMGPELDSVHAVPTQEEQKKFLEVVKKKERFYVESMTLGTKPGPVPFDFDVMMAPNQIDKFTKYKLQADFRHRMWEELHRLYDEEFSSHAVGHEINAFRDIFRRENIIAGLKRIVGAPYNSRIVREHAKRVNYSIVPGPNGEAMISIFGEKVEISDIIGDQLEATRKKLKNDVSYFYGTEEDDPEIEPDDPGDWRYVNESIFDDKDKVIVKADAVESQAVQPDLSEEDADADRERKKREAEEKEDAEFRAKREKEQRETTGGRKTTMTAEGETIVQLPVYPIIPDPGRRLALWEQKDLMNVQGVYLEKMKKVAPKTNLNDPTAYLEQEQVDALTVQGKQHQMHCVIAAPGYYTQNQINELRKSFSKARMNVRAVIPEAVAIALGFRIVPEKEGSRIAVMHMGGESFEFSILEVHQGQFVVTKAVNDPFFGAAQITQLVANHVLQVVKREKKVDLTQDPDAVAYIKDWAEAWKKQFYEYGRAYVEFKYPPDPPEHPPLPDDPLPRRPLEIRTEDVRGMGSYGEEFGGKGFTDVKTFMERQEDPERPWVRVAQSQVEMAQQDPANAARMSNYQAPTDKSRGWVPKPVASISMGKEFPTGNSQAEIDWVAEKALKIPKQRVELVFDISIEEFTKMIEPVIERAMNLVKKCLPDDEISSIDQFLSAGGGSRVLPLRHRVEGYLNMKAYRFPEEDQGPGPERIISYGCFRQAEFLAAYTGTEYDAEPYEFGVEVMGGQFHAIVNGAAPPVSNHLMFGTAVDNQEEIELRILQGGKTLAENNLFLGSVKIKVPPHIRRGLFTIRVTMKLDQTGILFCRIEEAHSGQILKEVVVKALNDPNSENLIIGDDDSLERENYQSQLLLARREAFVQVNDLYRTLRLHGASSEERVKKFETKCHQFLESISEENDPKVIHRKLKRLRLSEIRLFIRAMYDRAVEERDHALAFNPKFVKNSLIGTWHTLSGGYGANRPNDREYRQPRKPDHHIPKQKPLSEQD
eukprot:TRINITY_DN1949_c0_g2_i3.p1 TRINITY_DN1949_c0_g2~~TRINITY_DN1949_c0_g2_i3.p1  ORF type:complete len:1296 (-),score=451.61 TRINITY_DN1949_c0_g2_i3:55-3624(-)